MGHFIIRSNKHSLVDVIVALFYLTRDEDLVLAKNWIWGISELRGQKLAMTDILTEQFIQAYATFERAILYEKGRKMVDLYYQVD